MERTENIYRVEEDPNRSGVWWVLGLNLLASNKVPEVDHLMPFKVWLETMVGSEDVGVIQGGISIEYEGEWPNLPGVYWREIDTTLYAGWFESSRTHQHWFPGIYYPCVTRDHLVSGLMGVYLHYDTLAILSSAQDLELIVNALDPFPGEDEVLRRLRELTRWVILSKGDAQYLEIWSRSPTIQTDIERACETTDNAVKRLPWFQQVMQQLNWSHAELCYKAADAVG